MNTISGSILLVDDIDQSVQFYEKLGFKISKNVPHIATTVSHGGFWIELLDKNKVVTKSYKQHVSTGIPGKGSFLQMNVSNVDTFYEELIQKNVKVLEKPADYPWGHRECIIQDPDGYILCVYSVI